MGLDEILNSKEVLICCGSGGVGKTTISAALGVKAAETGKRVMVLTIDPARRLANSLGLDKFDKHEVEISPGAFKGTLFATMLDSKRVFDDFITRLAPSEELAQKVLSNPIYLQISTALSGSQEYTALERLLQLVQSQKYDLVILDTPPTKHAIDFLNAPGKIYYFFQEAILKWFLMPISTLDRFSLGLMNRGTKAALKGIEKVAGAEFLSGLFDFFTSIKDWQGALRDRASEVHRLLTSEKTGFILVTGARPEKIEEAKYFERTLNKGGYSLSAIIVNRCFPLWGGATEESNGQSNLKGSLLESYLQLKEYYRKLLLQYSGQMEAFHQFEKEPRPNVSFVKLPELSNEVNNVEGLKNLTQYLTS